MILVPVGCLFSGLVSGYLGRRKTMMLANLPFIAAWLLYYYSYNSAMLLSALAMTGITGGMLEAPVLTYVAEVCQPHLRGMLSATSTMSIMIGIFIQMLAGSLTTWRTVALTNIALPTVSFICLWMVPESPHWLVGMTDLRDCPFRMLKMMILCRKRPTRRSPKVVAVAQRLGKSCQRSRGVQRSV